jgi:hypothetical protein
VALDLTGSDMPQVVQHLGSGGNDAAARDLLRVIADAYRDSAAYGPKHPNTLAARHGLAHWTGQAGDAAGARDQLAELLSTSDRVLGPEHPHTLAIREALAHWSTQAGDKGDGTN